jgi:hypothetical protein
MYLASLAQMEDRRPPLSGRREALHRRTVLRARRNAAGGRKRPALRLAPHFRRGRAAPTSDPC